VSLSTKHDSKVFKKLNRLGIEPCEIGDAKYFPNLRFYDISEDNTNWAQVREILKANSLSDIARAEFTKEEILSAEWVWLKHGYFDEDIYPEPHEEHILWQKASFDYENICPECGIGLHQKAPIRLKGEPNLKDNDFLSIFWVYAIFARPEVLDAMLNNDIKGFEIFPAINHSSSVPLETIKQMKVTNELPPGLIADNLKRADVERMTADNIFTHKPYSCGHIKYYGTDQVMIKYKKNIFDNCPDFVMTSEWFGGGHEAVRLVLASSKFVRLYFDERWKGLSFSPIELV
jgi:hypothetical protein